MDDAPDRSPDGISPGDSTLGPSVDDELLRAVAAAPYASLALPELVAGDVIAETYEIIGTIGAGGMGVVYEAIDRALDRRVALKLHTSRGGAEAGRVWREARAMARLADPHVVTIHEVGLHDDRLFIAMELVAGTDARRWRRIETRSTAEILAVYRQAGLGLVAAHAVGIVHRDFKPDNVLVGDDGRVRVADFGLARAVDDEREALTTISSPGLLATDTRTGGLAGTPAYMAPELFAGDAADVRSDQFAFCVAVYEALTGARPQRSDPELPRRGLPRHVYEALRRGLARRPAERFTDIRALLRALEPPVRWGVRALVGAVVVGGVVATVLATRQTPCSDEAFAASAPWSADRSTAMATAFERSGFPDAVQISDRVAAALAAWSNGSIVARQAACVATHVHGGQSEARMQLRIDCIDRMQRRVGALVGALELADANAVARADDAVAHLPELSLCEDAETLATAEPIASADRAAHAALRDRIDALAVQRELGHHEGLVEPIATALADAELAGYADNVAAAALLQGSEALDRLSHEPAARSLGRAIAAGWRARDVDTTIDAMRLLARALAISPDRLDDALRWLDTAGELAHDVAPSRDRDARLLLTRADVFVMSGRSAEAERAARDALDRVEPGTAAEAAIRTTLGNALMAERRSTEAIDEHSRAVALTEELRGPNHPEVALRLSGLAVALDDAGRFDEAAPHIARLLALREAAFGPQSAAVAAALAQTGENLRMRNDAAGELAVYERAMAILATLDPPDDPLRIRLVGNMVPPLANAGRNGEARTLLQEALPVAQRVFGPDSMRVAELLQMLAMIEKAIGNAAVAIAHAEDALRLLERHLGVDHPRTAEARIALSSVMIHAQRYADAVAMLRRAQTTFEAVADPPARMLGLIAALEADALDGMGDDDAAMQAGDRALSLIEQAYPSGHVEVAEVISDHAERMVRAKRIDEARTLLVRARAMLEGPGNDPERREKVDRQLAELAE